MIRSFAYGLFFIIFIFCLGPVLEVQGKIDLVTLPERDSVQTTIYNGADLTLVRDKRFLTFQKGKNQLQFSWADTRIDPTSLSLSIKEMTDSIDVLQITYPPRTKDVGIWEIMCKKACQVPVEITYFTSGISWQSYYVAILSNDRKTASLKGYVRVTNHSGEDYENASTRLVVGKVNLLDQIAQLASQQYPYGQPVQLGFNNELKEAFDLGIQKIEAETAPLMFAKAAAMPPRPKKIMKESLSEYFLYSIEGTETIPDGWSKRLPSFSADPVTIENVYKFDVNQYGTQVIRFLRFKNDTAHNLGKTPLPGGEIKVYAIRDDSGSLNYIGSDNTKYIPVDEKVELNLGPASDIRITPKVMKYRKLNIIFDKEDNISGFDETKDVVIEMNNFSDMPVTVEIIRDIDIPQFQIENKHTPGKYEQIDQDSVKYTVELLPHSTDTVSYTLTIYRGERRWQH